MCKVRAFACKRRLKVKEEEPVCANCSKNHPANYRGCEVQKAYNNIILERTTRERQQRQVSIVKSHPIRSATSGASFSSIVKRWNTPTRNTPTNQQRHQPSKASISRQSNEAKENFVLFENEIKDLFKMNFTNLMIHITEFYKTFSKIKDANEKKNSFVLFMLNFISTEDT